MVGLGTARGVTEFDGSDFIDQPTPVSVVTVKVYAVPFVRPSAEHDIAGAATRQV
jgi:hypothetical protein